MKLIWSKSKLPLSLLIRSITGNDCSHFSFVFESQGRSGLMFESNLIGTHPSFLQSSLKNHTIVHQLDLMLTTEDEDKIWDIIVEKYDNKPYDFLGAIYLGWHKLLNRLFGIKLPEINKWSQPDQYYCDEIYDILNKLPQFPKIDVKGGMQTPHDIYLQLKARI